MLLFDLTIKTLKYFFKKYVDERVVRDEDLYGFESTTTTSKSTLSATTLTTNAQNATTRGEGLKKSEYYLRNLYFQTKVN